MEKHTYHIKGMHCASCSSIITSSLSEIDGIKSVDVNFATEKAQIEYEPDKISVERINEEIGKLGYTLVSQQDESGKEPAREMRHRESMDHAEHTGIVMDKEEKLAELTRMKNRVGFVLPIALVVFFVMIWDILARVLDGVPNPPMSMGITNIFFLILSTVILFWVGKPFIDGVVRFMKYRVANMDTLIGIGTLTAYIYSVVIVLLPQIKSYFSLPDDTYFDVIIGVIGFVMLGKYLEAKSKMRTGEAIEKLIGLQAKTALVMRGGKEIEIPVGEVVVGDIVIVKPGAKIPVDGKIVEGKTSIDESMITGEPIPADKIVGDSIIGGTINKQGSFSFEATKVGGNTMLAQIVKMVEEAQGSKAPIQTLVDRVSAVFVPVVLVTAVLSFLVWIILGTSFLGFSTALSYGILSLVGVLVIACPCALGLATPTAIIVGVGKAAEYGILIKNAESLERLNSIDTIVLDKTGTITVGKPQVSDVIILDERINKEDVVRYAASAEKKSEHPLAQAIVDEAKAQDILFLDVVEFEALEGMGVKAVVDQKKVYVRKPLSSDNYKEIDDLQKQGKTVVMVEINDKAAGIIALSDIVKPEAKEAVARIRNKGIKVVMLTGDNLEAANHIARQVGITEVIANVLPQEKANKIKQLQKEGRKVAMAGDGINDAPALAQADVGIAMATGTDVAIESAGITLLHGDISKLSQAVELSRATMTTIKQNLFWAFIYNIIGIPIAAGVLYPFWGIVLNPIFAGLAMAGSSVSVVSNSLRLRAKRF